MAEAYQTQAKIDSVERQRRDLPRNDFPANIIQMIWQMTIQKVVSIFFAHVEMLFETAKDLAIIAKNACEHTP